MGFFSNLVSVIAIAFFIPESPLYLLKADKIYRAQIILQQILKTKRSDCIAMINDLDQCGKVSGLSKSPNFSTQDLIVG